MDAIPFGADDRCEIVDRVFGSLFFVDDEVVERADGLEFFMGDFQAAGDFFVGFRATRGEP